MNNEINNSQENLEVQQAVAAALGEQKKKSKKKKLIIFGIIAALIMIGIISSSISAFVNKPADVEPNSLNAITGESVINADTIGDYGCVVKAAELCKDYMGKDAVLITYEFTNNSKEATSFDITFIDEVFQGGVGLEFTFLDEEDIDGFAISVKPGVTTEIKRAYVLRDSATDLEIEISEFLSFNDYKIVTNVKIAE